MARTMRYRPEADANFLAAAQRFRALASEVRAPTLVISGDDDHLFRPRRAARSPNCSRTVAITSSTPRDTCRSSSSLRRSFVR